MNKKKIATILLASILLSSCSASPSQETTAEADVTTTSEETTITEVTESTAGTAATSTSSYAQIADEFLDLEPGDVFTFGEYEGDELDWIVLSKTVNVIYCLSEETVTFLPYDEEGHNNEWNGSSLSNWLNDDFYNSAFTDEEKVRIKFAYGTNYPSVSHENKIYLLNRSDFENYRFILADHELTLGWWLRSYNNNDDTTADICDSNGDISYGGCDCSTPCGVRPAMKIYIGTDPDALDLSNLYPEQTEAPDETSETSERPLEGDPVPYEPSMMTIPAPMPADASLSEEANLDAFYNNCLVPTVGQVPLDPITTEASGFGGPWLDVHGALNRTISDFDGDGDLEMVSFVLVAEEQPYQYIVNGNVIDNTYAYQHYEVVYRIHLVLIDEVDGQVCVIKDLPVQSQLYDQDNINVSRDIDHSTISNCTYWQSSVTFYTVDRDGKKYVIVENQLKAYTFSDGYTAAAFMFEITPDDILYASAYCEEMGTADTSAVQVTYENGVEVSRETYYSEPEIHDASPDMLEGLDLYYSRIGLSTGERDLGYGVTINDGSATRIADVSICPGERNEDGLVPITYQVRTA